MLELKVGKTYRNGFGKEIQIVSQDTEGRYPYKGHNGISYTFNGVFNRTFDSKDDLVEEVTFDLTHSDIQLLRKNLINRLKDIKYPISASETRCEYYYERANIGTPEGIKAFHELNSAKDSLRRYKKERKHVAELLRKLKKQQADILRNNAKV